MRRKHAGCHGHGWCMAAILAALVLGACRGTEWADADTTGCDRQVVAQLNQPDGRHDAEVARTTAVGMCAAKGYSGSTGAFRCDGHVMQVQCRR